MENFVPPNFINSSIDLPQLRSELKREKIPLRNFSKLSPVLCNRYPPL